VRPDTHNGLIFGGIAGITTVGLNLINVVLVSGNGCPQRGTILPLVAFAVFVVLAGVAGRRAEARGGSAAIAGAGTGAVSGLAMPILVVFGIVTANNAEHACAGSSQIDLISLSAIGGVLGLVIFLAGIAVGAAAGALGALFGGPEESPAA
jgi:hypothetical protein